VLQAYHIYLSHSWRYKDAYERIVNLLSAQEYYCYVDHAVPPDDPVQQATSAQTLYDAILEHMQSCQVLLSMAGAGESYQKWTNKELYIAKHRLSIPAILVVPWENLEITRNVMDSYDQVVGWQTHSVVAAMRSLCG